MKILVSIPDYKGNQMEYLTAVINEYKSYKDHEVTINVHSTVDIPVGGINLVSYDPKTVSGLVHVHRQEFVDNQDNYDLFIFSENDILIREESINTFLAYDEQLPADHSIGFIRYEQRVLDAPEDKNLWLLDLWPHVGYIETNDVMINGIPYFVLTNRFQSCFVLTREKLKYAIAHGDFLNTNWRGVERASASVYRGGGECNGAINRVYMRNRNGIKKLLIHHLPDRHVNASHPMNPTDANPFWQSGYPGDKFCKNTATFDQLISDLNL